METVFLVLLAAIVIFIAFKYFKTGGGNENHPDDRQTGADPFIGGYPGDFIHQDSEGNSGEIPGDYPDGDQDAAEEDPSDSRDSSEGSYDSDSTFDTDSSGFDYGSDSGSDSSSDFSSDSGGGSND